MHNPTHHSDPIEVDARHAGGTITVELDTTDELFANCVILDVPDTSAVVLYPREARALSAALTTAAVAGTEQIEARSRALAAERRTGREEGAL